jgi:hypothetical protein
MDEKLKTIEAWIALADEKLKAIVLMYFLAHLATMLCVVAKTGR